MKAKIIGFDPAGVIVDNSYFALPLIPELVSTPLTYGPTKKVRYMLEIGDYRYWVMPNGELDKI